MHLFVTIFDVVGAAFAILCLAVGVWTIGGWVADGWTIWRSSR